MREIFLKKRDINHLDFVKRSALESDYELFIEDDVIAIDEDTKQIIFVHKKLDFDDRQIMWALDRIKYEENTRTSGLKTRSRIFGFNPRNAIRK
ncbi:MAG: hypothetical protein WC822_06860, partial [Candidatus Paceibacterota bacterium]